MKPTHIENITTKDTIVATSLTRAAKFFGLNPKSVKKYVDTDNIYLRQFKIQYLK